MRSPDQRGQDANFPDQVAKTMRRYVAGALALVAVTAVVSKGSEFVRGDSEGQYCVPEAQQVVRDSDNGLNDVKYRSIIVESGRVDLGTVDVSIHRPTLEHPAYEYPGSEPELPPAIGEGSTLKSGDIVVFHDAEVCPAEMPGRPNNIK